MRARVAALMQAQRLPPSAWRTSTKISICDLQCRFYWIETAKKKTHANTKVDLKINLRASSIHLKWGLGFQHLWWCNKVTLDINLFWWRLRTSASSESSFPKTFGHLSASSFSRWCWIRPCCTGNWLQPLPRIWRRPEFRVDRKLLKGLSCFPKIPSNNYK